MGPLPENGYGSQVDEQQLEGEKDAVLKDVRGDL